MSEDNISGILDTLMYVLPEADLINNRSEITVRKAVEQLNDIEFAGLSEDEKEHFENHLEVVVAAIAKNENIGELVISNPSWGIADPGFNEGTVACTFSDPEGGDVFVAFRGTEDGEWLDNSVAFSGKDSIQQQEASEYFDYVAGNYINDKTGEVGLSADQNIVITGHSKGGNKAQYVTMTAENKDLIDTCYSFDGQGFSPEQLEEFKKMENYDELRSKIYGINGKDDYVHVLGYPIIPEDQITYIEYTEPGFDFNDAHSIHNLFDEEGKLNAETYQGDISKLVEEMSLDVLSIEDPEIRKSVSMGAMGFLEMLKGDEWIIGLNGEEASLKDYFNLLVYGAKMIFDNKEDVIRVISKELYNKFGNWGVVGFIVGVTVLIGAVVTAGMVTVAVGMLLLKELINVTKTILNEVGELLVEIVDMLDGFVDCLEDFFAGIFNSKSNQKGKTVQVISNYISLDTNVLRTQANTLYSINNRIKVLDGDMNSLYFSVGWKDLGKILGANLVMDYRIRVKKCADYLQNTATAFDAVEQAIANA